MSEPMDAEPVEIPFRELSADALRGVIEVYVLREGTDYGEVEYSLDDKVERVLRQLQRREARIVFNPNDESVSLELVG
jgi:hypothetical protein